MTTTGDGLPQTRFDITADLPPVPDLGAVHVLAVGGAGMSAVARLLGQAGLVVSGCDGAEGPVLDALRAEGIAVSVGHDASHLDGADTVVVSSAIRESNPELAAARAAGLRVLHRSQGLAALVRERAGVAVAGANGKTTTTSMLASALVSAGADPSYAIGGELSAHGTNAHLGSGPAFVVEADESDGTFLAYRPRVAVVTNVQPDHLDHYGTYERVEAAYLAFARTIAPGGLLVACADDDGSGRLAERARAAGVDVVTYGTSVAADVVVTPEPSPDALAGRATVRLGNVDHTLEIALPGRHNLLNATAALVAATRGLGVDADAVLTGLAEFGGVRRRFEVKGEAAGVRVVDDYAHNPGKVAALVSTAAPLAAPGRLVVLFQPHLYSRTRDFVQEFAVGLAPADLVLVMDVYAAREDAADFPGVTGALVADAVTALGTEATYLPDRAVVARTVAALLRPGDLLATVGAGDVTGIGPEVLEILRGRDVRR